MKSLNPATEEIVGEVQESTQQDVLNAVSKARKAFETWKNTKYSERASILSNFENILKERKNEIAQLIAKEMGKPITQSREEVDGAVGELNWFINNTEKYISDEKLLDQEQVEGFISFEPVGVFGVISPWNYPIDTLIWKTIPVLLTGSTIVSKVSEYVCLMGVEFEKMLSDAGLPEGVFNSVNGNYKIGEFLNDAPVQQVCFTGSVRAGKIVGGKSTGSLKRVILELGGSDAFVVLEDADLDAAVESAVFNRFANCGQICTAAKRFFIQDSIYETFKQKFLEKTQDYKIGNPLDEDTTLGPIVSDTQRDFLEKQVNESISQGAKILTGGKRTSLNGKGYFFEPTVLENCCETVAMREELFGPVAPLESFTTVEESLQKANNSEFGLGGSIWSKDIEKAKQLAKKLDTGMVWINDHGMPYPELPWVGKKNSGIGHELSKYGILDVVHTKPIIFPK